jgi:hypothetical protein
LMPTTLLGEALRVRDGDREGLLDWDLRRTHA